MNIVAYMLAFKAKKYLTALHLHNKEIHPTNIYIKHENIK
jgi:hypothetical protein